MKPAERLEPSESPDSVETIEGHGDSPRTPVLLDEIQPSMLHTHNDGDVPATRITRHFIEARIFHVKRKGFSPCFA